MEGATVDEIYDTICSPEKLASLKCLESLKSLVSNSTFNLELPFDHIKEYVNTTRDEVLGEVSKEVMEACQMEWQHVGEKLDTIMIRLSNFFLISQVPHLSRACLVL